MGGFAVVNWLLLGLCCWVGEGVNSNHNESGGDLVLCSKAPNSLKHAVGKRFYIEAVNLMNWYQAMAYCRTRGMDLASIQSREEQDVVAALISNITGPSKYEFWISGTDQGTDEHFVWLSSGTPMTYTNWAPKEPVTEKNCVEVRWDRLWRTWDCDYRMFAICEYYYW